MLVKIFKSDLEGEKDPWFPILAKLAGRGVEVNFEPVKCDLAIFIGGKRENPLGVQAKKKILVYSNGEWVPNGMFSIMEPVLEEYYDEMHDVCEMNFMQIVNYIDDLYRKVENEV